jgi:hypothetical protein
MKPARLRHAMVWTAGAALASAAAYESPHTFKASQVLTQSQVKGPHHTVASTVKTDGYYYLFEVTTDYGPLEVEGRGMLLMRLHEVGALAELDEVSKSEVFLKAAGTSVLNVGKGVTAAVKDPGATAKGLGGGVKRFGTNLGRKAKRSGDKALDAATSDDDAKQGEVSGDSASSGAAKAGAGMAYSMLGVTSASRKWAQKVGVDPYTTNPILKKALADLGQIDAAGSIAGKVVVPIPPVVRGTASVGNMVWAKDPEEVLKLNEQKLKELGVGGDVIKELYLSKGLSLTMHTRLASALHAVRVPGCADYVATAAEADTEREAAFFVEGAEMLSLLHAKTPVVAVLSDSRAVVAKTKDGRAIALLPVDWVRWTEAYQKALDEVVKRVRSELGVTRLEVHLTGKMSATAKKEMGARGFKVVEGLPSSFEIVQQRARAAQSK